MKALFAFVVIVVCAGCDQGSAPAVAPQQADPAVSAVAVPALVTPAEFTKSAREASSADGTYRVKWEAIGGVIPDAEPFAIAVGVARADGKALTADVRVSVDAEMPHHGHGMNLVPQVARRGTEPFFVASGLLFHMSGRWVLAVDVTESGVTERAQWYVDIE